MVRWNQCIRKASPVSVLSLAFSSGGLFLSDHLPDFVLLLTNSGVWGDLGEYDEVSENTLVTAGLSYTSSICMGRHYKGLLCAPQKLLISF